MAELRIRVLGELAVLREGVAVPLPQSRKTRALLAYLVLEPGPHRRDRLCELFWSLPDDPRGSLRWSLSKLRGLVNEPVVERITADRERVRFHPLETVVDLQEVAAMVAAGLERLDEADLKALARLLVAECLAGLDPVEGLDFHAFLTSQRSRARELRRTVLKALTDRLADRPGEAAEWLQQLLEVEPMELEHHRRLIESLALAGRRRDAERQMAVSLTALDGIRDIDRVSLQRAVHARPLSVPRATRPVEEALAQTVRFCRAADGTQIAHASCGEGPPLVKAANWLNHLEFDWESPVWRHVFRGLSLGRRLIRYDARGNGLSDWDVDEYSVDALVSDLEAVVDACGLERFALLGISQGCAISVEYAARHPHRVSGLILLGGYARGWNRVGSRTLSEQVEAMLLLIRMGWGQDHATFRQLFTSLFMPDAPAENHVWFNELQRVSSSPENAARLLKACGDVDVRQRLGDVQAPTLVLHARRELATPMKGSRELAGGIPGARFVSLDTRNHLLPESDPAWLHALQEIEAFLAELG